MKCLYIILLVLVGSVYGADKKATAEFQDLRKSSWSQTFFDSCAGRWQDKWFLDGDQAKVTNKEGHMSIDTADGYAVLWTKDSFAGDVRIEYDFKRADESNLGVNIIYIQATGDGQKEYAEDITKWSNKRKKAAMSDYFMNMHAYHISYAAFGNKKPASTKDYVRGRRYLPEANKGMKKTKLKGEYQQTDLFLDRKWIHVTIIKKAKKFWIEFQHPDKTLLCHFENTDKPAIDKGRIGLRLMPKRLSQFKNFKVMNLKTKDKALKINQGGS